jgi:hypothetical protein
LSSGGVLDGNAVCDLMASSATKAACSAVPVAILRDARERALLRMRSELFHTLRERRLTGRLLDKGGIIT